MNERQEIRLQIKWLAISITICVLFGVLIAGIQVLFFEQTPSGRYATKEICVEYDMACEEACSQADYDPQSSGISCDCCLQTKTIAVPLGKRINEVAKLYSLIAGSFGIVIGLSIADEKKKKL